MPERVTDFWFFFVSLLMTSTHLIFLFFLFAPRTSHFTFVQKKTNTGKLNNNKCFLNFLFNECVCQSNCNLINVLDNNQQLNGEKKLNKKTALALMDIFNYLHYYTLHIDTYIDISVV